MIFYTYRDKGRVEFVIKTKDDKDKPGAAPPKDPQVHHCHVASCRALFMLPPPKPHTSAASLMAAINNFYCLSGVTTEQWAMSSPSPSPPP